LALQRSEALLGPPLLALKERLETELPALKRAIEAASSEFRQELRALRAEQGAEAARLQSELSRLNTELPEISGQIHRNADAISAFAGVHRDLRLASESVQTGLQEAVGSLNAKMLEMIENAVGAAERKWQGWFQGKVEALEASLREVDTRARHDACAAMDTAKMVQDLLQCRIEELRLQASQESRRCAAEVAAGLREEVLEGELLAKFKLQLHQSATSFEARVAALQAKLSARIDSSSAEALAAAERSTEAKLFKLASEVAEAVEATRREVAAQRHSHAEATEEWRLRLKDATANFDAAGALMKSSLDNLTGRVARVADETTELRDSLGQARRSAHDDVSALRTELHEKSLQWRAFEEVGIPTIVAHVEQRSVEHEGRSLRAALDYAERLRRLPPALPSRGESERSPESKQDSVTRAPSLGQTRLFDAGSDLVSTSPLPPLTPMSGRKTKAH